MNELQTILLTLLVAILPNLILKWAEKSKTAEDREKTNLESADIAKGMLQDTVETLKEHNTYLDEKLKWKRDEYEKLYSDFIKEKHARMEAETALAECQKELERYRTGQESNGE